jgi:hypothetical protein
MDHIILEHNEEIVCPEIFAHCFQSGDPIQLWYMDNDSLWKSVVTTKPGCLGGFKAFFEQRFSVDVGLRQIEPEDRIRYPHKSYANFAIEKIYLIRPAFEHLAPSTIIAMIKRKLDGDAILFCHERKDVNEFITELMEFDNLRAMQATRQPAREHSAAKLNHTSPSQRHRAATGSRSNVRSRSSTNSWHNTHRRTSIHSDLPPNQPQAVLPLPTLACRQCSYLIVFGLLRQGGVHPAMLWPLSDGGQAEQLALQVLVPKQAGMAKEG